VVLSMVMMHVCISSESIPRSKHVYWYTWLSCQKPCLTLVYYSANTVFLLYVTSKDSNSLAACWVASIYLLLHRYICRITYARLCGTKFIELSMRKNVTAIYGGMICQLAVKLHGNLWQICFCDYILLFAKPKI